jgi:predicted Zn-dependent protease
MDRFAGQFADGRSAARLPVTVVLGRDGLAILDTGGRQLAVWPYRSLRLVEDVYRNQPVRLRSKGSEGRLSVEDQAILNSLRPLAGRLRGGDMRGARTLPRALGWTAATVGAVVLLYFILPLMAEPIAGMVPRSWEERLGRAVMRQVATVFGHNGRLTMCRAPAGRAALDGLVGRLAAAAETKYVFRVQVVDSPIVNAMAAPGGYIVIFRGLIDRAHSAEEVAGVLGHEMGHVIERHGTEALIRAQGLRLLFGTTGESTSLEFGTTLLTLSYGRAAESEADRIGVTLLNRANIRGAGLVEFFRRLGGKPGGRSSLLRFLATHPPTAERAAAIEARAAGTGDAMSAAEWQALRAICTVRG